MELYEKTISSEKVFDGVVVNLKVDTVILPDGNMSKREIIEHPGGVCVVAVDDDKNVLLVRQYRTAAEKVLLEIPAGKLEYGEDISEAGKRELKEETGATAGKFIPMGYFFPTPAYCQEKIYMFYAENLSFGEQNLDDGEFLEVVRIPYDKLYGMVINDEIDDGKTALAILKAKRFIKD